MLPALLWLTLRSYRNRLVRRLRSFRNVRSWLALAAGLAYVVLIVKQPTPGARTFVVPTQLATLLGLMLFLGSAWAWLGPIGASPIALGAPEVFHLLPAPIARGTLVLYKLARWQLPLLFNAVVLTVVLSARSDPLSGLRRVLALWVLLATFRMHWVVAALARRSPVGRVRQLAMPVAGTVMAALGAAMLLAGRHLVSLAPRMFALRVIELPMLVAGSPVFHWALWPWTALALPVASSRVGAAWAPAMAAPLALCALHAWLILRAPHALDLAAADVLGKLDPHGTRRAEDPSRMLIALGAVGWPGLAIVWRQLGPRLRRRRAAWIAGLAGVVAVALLLLPSLGLESVRDGVVLTLLIWTGVSIVAGPLWMRFGIRRELHQRDRLRELPITPRDLVLSMAIASWLAALGVQYTLLAALALAMHGPAPADLDLQMAVGFLPWVAFVLPVVTAAGALVTELGAIWFPDWVRRPLARGAGIDVLGTNLVSLLAYVAGTALVLTIPVLAAFRAFVAVTGRLAGPVALTVFWFVAAIEVFGLLRVGARAFVRMPDRDSIPQRA
jgi:hypothetical protein